MGENICIIIYLKRGSSENIKGTPITRYDVEKKVVYLEYPDGHIEYAKEA